ncbi:MAG: rhodanese-like domain-containing protein [Deltaproteobacteria bacterium]|nr:rhodanese-like domain-containing protein [Deltaproteobacteria bacterium]
MKVKDIFMEMPVKALGLSALEALGITFVIFLIAILFNHLRPGSIPLVRKTPFEVYTLCPEVSGKLPRISVDKLPPGEKRLFFVDSRLSGPYCKSHIPDAAFMPMYPLDIPDFSRLKNLPPGSWIIVYGATDLQSDERMVSELMKLKLRGVYLLEGGIASWVSAGRSVNNVVTEEITHDKLKGNELFIDADEELLPDGKRYKNALIIPPDNDIPPEKSVLEKVLKSSADVVVFTREKSMKKALDVGCELKARGVKVVRVLKGLPTLKEVEK